MNRPNEVTDIEKYQPPKWVLEVLRLSELATISESADHDIFTKRCADAARLAVDLVKLHQARQRVGFVPVSGTDYIRRLIELVGIPQSPFFSWLSEADSSFNTRERAAAFAQLAQRIGMSLREALAHLRIDFSAQMGSSPVPLLLARTRSSESFSNPIENCEVVLSEIESNYDIDSLRQLRVLETELRTSYDRFKDLP